MPQKNTLHSVVSNTGPLISLERMEGGFDFAKKLYKSIYIPETVLKEVSYFHLSPESYIEHHNIFNLIKVARDPLNAVLMTSLDPGEACAICLAQEMMAKENPPQLLLIEERKGRDVAESFNIPISGIAGRIISAKDNKIISEQEARRMLLELFNKKRINKALLNMFLDDF